MSHDLGSSQTMTRHRRSTGEWKHIRELFSRRKVVYSLAEVSEVLDISPALVHQAAEQGTITVRQYGEDVGVEWKDVVVLGMECRWTIRTISEALQGSYDPLVPTLARARAGRIVLPLYQWKVLRLLAAQRSRAERRDLKSSDLIEESVSAALISGIDDWTSLEAHQPGLRAAADWPG